ncbi:MAG: selenium metabolism-associated LysR family transcriptional regulator [Chloroflexota bacterium]
MNLDYLKTYRDVITLGSFSEAAKKLGISQPAVSFQIQRLERELGVRLIDRIQKTLTMTEAGKRVLAFAEAVEGETSLLVRDLDRLREEVVGELVIAASTIPGEYLLPVLLSEFKTQHPAVGVQVAVFDSLTVISLIENGTYEIGFCGTPPQGRELESFKMAGDEIVLIVFPEHPFARRNEVTLMEVVEEPIIFREETSGTQQSVESELLRAGFAAEKFTPKLVLGTTQAVVSAVEAGAGIAFISSLAIKKSCDLGLVRVVKVSGFTLRRDFFCIRRKERIVSRLLSEFTDFIRAGARA